MSLTKEYTANKQLDKISDQKLIELIVNEVQNFLKADLRSINSHPGLNSPFVNIPLGISNRHIHLTPKTFHMLFGE